MTDYERGRGGDADLFALRAARLSGNDRRVREIGARMAPTWEGHPDHARWYAARRAAELASPEVVANLRARGIDVEQYRAEHLAEQARRADVAWSRREASRGVADDLDPATARALAEQIAEQIEQDRKDLGR